MRQELLGALRDIHNRRVEGGLIGLRRGAKAAHFPDKLKCCRGNLVGSRGRLRPAKNFDTPAHRRDYYATVAEFLHEPSKFDGSGVILTHGAGGNCQSPLLVAVADALAAAGSLVIRYDLPFREKGGGGAFTPARAAADRAGIREKVNQIRTRAEGPVIVAGHSYGGRQGSMLLAEDPELADGLLLLSYPLHPPGKPEQLRTEHFPQMRKSALFVSGARDPFGTPEELSEALKSIPAATRLITIPKAGHDLARGKFDVASMVRSLRNLVAVS